MVASCGVGAMVYMLPMLLGRTYDMGSSSVGIDIYDPKDVEEAGKNPVAHPEVRSSYMTIQDVKDKRKFLGIEGDLAAKILSGNVNLRGSGEYLRDESNSDRCVEIMIKATFVTQIQHISPDAKPLPGWENMDRNIVGTHVVVSVKYGGEIYASVRFCARKEEFMEQIKAQVDATISKSGSFDINAQGQLEKLANNLTHEAKMEMDFYSTTPLKDVPTTIEGLQNLVGSFKELVEKVNNGVGVAICVDFRPLSDFSSKFKYLRSKELMNSMDAFNYKFENLRVAKSLLRTYINELPSEVPEEYLQKILDFSERLSDTLSVFYQVIANLNLEQGSQQLSPADKAFDDNSNVKGLNRYTKEIKRIISEYKASEEIIRPRGLYVNWGKRTCDNQASNIVYIGTMAAAVEVGIGAGTNYQCMPENPNLKMSFDTSGLNAKTSKLAAVRFSDMSMFANSKQLQNKVVPCVICETPMRTTVKMFPGMSCPGDWVQEYRGYIASNADGRLRSEHVCVNRQPDPYKSPEKAHGDPVLMPVKMGEPQDDKFKKDASITCSVCSK